MAGFSNTAHWRDSAHDARFFLIDARAAFPLLLFLMNIAYWTLYTSLAFVLFFAMIERWGFTLPIFFRWLRNVIGGNYKSANPWWRQ